MGESGRTRAGNCRRVPKPLMTSPKIDLPAEVQAALERGDKIAAIRLLSQRTGLGLREAMLTLGEEATIRETTATPPSQSITISGKLPPDVLEALGKGDKIEAIKRLRDATGLGLKEAKYAVDAVTETLAAGKPSVSGRWAQSESPRSRLRAPWLIALVMLIIFLGWQLFRVT